MAFRSPRLFRYEAMKFKAEGLIVLRSTEMDRPLIRPERL